MSEGLEPKRGPRVTRAQLTLVVSALVVVGGLMCASGALTELVRVLIALFVDLLVTIARLIFRF